MHPSVFNLNQNILSRKPNHQSDQQTSREINSARFVLVVFRIKLTINMLLITLSPTVVTRVCLSVCTRSRVTELFETLPTSFTIATAALSAGSTAVMSSSCARPTKPHLLCMWIIEAVKCDQLTQLHTWPLNICIAFIMKHTRVHILFICLLLFYVWDLSIMCPKIV